MFSYFNSIDPVFGNQRACYIKFTDKTNVERVITRKERLANTRVHEVQKEEKKRISPHYHLLTSVCDHTLFQQPSAKWP